MSGVHLKIKKKVPKDQKGHSCRLRFFFFFLRSEMLKQSSTNVTKDFDCMFQKSFLS